MFSMFRKKKENKEKSIWYKNDKSDNVDRKIKGR